MAKIRDDLEGIALTETGLILRAGDEIPAGVKVGDHLLAEKSGDEGAGGSNGGQETPAGGATGSSDASTLTPPPRGGAGSGADAWRAYASAAAEKQGLEIEIPDDATRDDIIKALEGADIPVE